MKSKKKRKLKRVLILDKNFIPASQDDGDEVFPSGIFVFNITKMISFIKSNPDQFIPISVPIDDYGQFSVIDEDYIVSFNNPDPVVMAEIAPNKYNLIDGNHRLEKARRSGLKSIMAYQLSMEQHINYLTSQKAYYAYVGYWNEKIRDL